MHFVHRRSLYFFTDENCLSAIMARVVASESKLLSVGGSGVSLSDFCGNGYRHLPTPLATSPYMSFSSATTQQVDYCPGRQYDNHLILRALIINNPIF